MQGKLDGGMTSSEDKKEHGGNSLWLEHGIGWPWGEANGDAEERDHMTVSTAGSYFPN